MTNDQLPSDDPLVTCVITFLNGEKFLKEAINSVLQQDYTNWELVLVDDGSSDRSAEIARSYCSNRPQPVVYVTHPNLENRGMSTSRNLGIRYGTGEFIALLDADDVWLPGKLREQVRLLMQYPEAAMVYGRTLKWYSWTGASKDIQRDTVIPQRTSFDMLMDREALLLEMVHDGGGASPSTGSVILRRSAFDFVHGFDDRFRDMYEDMVFHSKLSIHFPIYISSSIWSLYRKHAESSCAVAYREGRSRLYSAHRAFLEVVTEYYSEVDEPSALMQQTLMAALEPYRHPIRYRVRQCLSPSWWSTRLTLSLGALQPNTRRLRKNLRQHYKMLRQHYKMLRSMVHGLKLAVRRLVHPN